MARAPSPRSSARRSRRTATETEGQIERLQQVFEIIGKRAQGKTCAAMDGIIEEGRGDPRRVRGLARARCRPRRRRAGRRALRDHPLRHAAAWADQLGMGRRGKTPRADARRGKQDRQGADDAGRQLRQREGQGCLSNEIRPARRRPDLYRQMPLDLGLVEIARIARDDDLAAVDDDRSCRRVRARNRNTVRRAGCPCRPCGAGNEIALPMSLMIDG